MTDVEERLSAMALRGVGPAVFRKLTAAFGSWSAALAAPVEELARVPGVGGRAAEAIRSPRQWEPAAEIEAASRLGVRIVPDTDPLYPPALKVLDDAPLVLYVRGTIQPEDVLAVAVIGTRGCSLYGQTQAERLSGGLAAAGVAVVSGLARGIDAAAHRGALRANGRTIAVMGCGLGRVYPPEHKELADRIAEQGALVSELPVATPPRPENFPARNRLIAGLSLGVVVVEAPAHSGALITARLAAEMGREVFAVPGEISRPQSRGCHELIRDGAKIVSDVRDIMEEIESLRSLSPGPDAPVMEPPPPRLNPVERAVYQALDEAPKAIDQIVREAELTAANAASALLALELRGLVKQLPGKQFCRASRR